MVAGKARRRLSDVQILGSHSDRNACHEATVLVPAVLAWLVAAVYNLHEHSGREYEVKGQWETLGYNRMSSEVSGNTGKDVWYAVFIRNQSCQYTRAPNAVIAVRGTVIPNIVDFKSNMRLLGRALVGDSRFNHLKEVADRVVNMFGHEHVSIAGHSLGAALALIVAKALVKIGRPIEAYLFNPPFPSAFDVVCSKRLLKLVKSCKVMLLAMYKFLSVLSLENDDLLILIQKVSANCPAKCKWTPHMFLNNGDFVNVGYIDHVIDLEVRGDAGFWRQLKKWAASHTLLSLITGKTPPDHLLASADFTIADSYGRNFFKSHALEQWYKTREWESGNQVEGLDFGSFVSGQLCQRTYKMRRTYIKLGDSDAKVMAYSQTNTAKLVQATVSTATLGFATSKQKEVFFLFNTEQDAKTAERQWPQELRNWRINDDILAQAWSFEFQFRKFEKGRTTFYIYAVKSRGVTFHREIEWKALLKEFEVMGEVTDWVKYIRRIVYVAAILP